MNYIRYAKCGIDFAGAKRKIHAIALNLPCDHARAFAPHQQAKDSKMIDLYDWPTPNRHKVLLRQTAAVMRA